MERIGIYGGTFNPPHVGHIRAAVCACDRLGLSKMLLIPSCNSPHKTLPADSPTPEQRLKMLQLSIGDVDKLLVSDIELQRGGSSYTYETVELLKNQYPDAERILFMGTDMFLSFLNWKYPERILACVALGVYYRGTKEEKIAISQQKERLEALGAKVYLVDNPVTEISSTDLRRMLIMQCADGFLVPEVLTFIQQNGLYGTGRNYRQLLEEELEEVIVSLLKPSRVNHVRGCREEAVKLAKFWGADVTDAARAALLHDVTKALDGPLQLELCRQYGVSLDDFSVHNPKTLHALTGSLVAKRIFGESDAVVSAICSHTTGKANMNLLEKIIYVADYMEPNRDFPGVEELRRLAYSDINAALRRGLEMTLDMLKRQGSEISRQSDEALRYLQERG